jgi:hypothetical protein
MCFSVEDTYIAELINCQSGQQINQNIYLFTNENGFSLELEYSFPDCNLQNTEFRKCDGSIAKSFTMPFLDSNSCSVKVKFFLSAGDDCSQISIFKKLTRNIGDYEHLQTYSYCSNPLSFNLPIDNNLCFKVQKI